MPNTVPPRDILFHGSPLGNDTFPEDKLNIAQKYYSGLPVGGKNYQKIEFIEFKGQRFTCYTLFVGKRVNDCQGISGRSGSYFAISLICQNFYYTNVNEIFSELEAAFRNKADFLLQRIGNGGYKFKISSFNQKRAEVDTLRQQINLSLDSTFSDFRPIVDTPNYQPTTLSGRDIYSNAEIIETLLRTGCVILDEDAPTKMELENNERAREIEKRGREELARREQELTQQSAEEKRRLQLLHEQELKAKEAEIERIRKSCNSELNQLKRDIQEKKELISQQSSEYAKLADQIKSLKNRLYDIELKLLKPLPPTLPSGINGGHHLGDERELNEPPYLDPPITDIIRKHWKIGVIILAFFFLVLVLMLIRLSSGAKPDPQKPNTSLVTEAIPPETTTAVDPPSTIDPKGGSQIVPPSDNSPTPEEFIPTSDFFNSTNFKIDVNPYGKKLIAGKEIRVKIVHQKNISEEAKRLYEKADWEDFKLTIFDNSGNKIDGKEGRDIGVYFPSAGNYTLKWHYKGNVITRSVTVNENNDYSDD